MKVIENYKIPHEDNTNIIFIRIDPEDLSETLSHILETLMDLSWLSRYKSQGVRKGHEIRAQKTVKDIKSKFDASCDDNITSEAGEYVVSELAREAIQNELGYLHIPLAELLGMKISGNPGFDFHSQNPVSNTIIFGESKFNSRNSAYSTAIEQISDFIVDQKDVMQIPDLSNHCTEIAIDRASDGYKGFAIAFSAKKTKSVNMIKSIVAHKDFTSLLPYEEILVVAVNL